mgnify:CR=1 FL=1
MKKAALALTLLSLILFPFTAFADEGIPLQMDVFLGSPIYGPEDLPEQITFNLYDSQGALVPLGSQTFTRGQYTVDFEFSQSDGVSSGNVARINAQFTQKLDLLDEFGESLKPKEIWAALEVGGDEVGARTKVPDETMVQLLLNSDASMATYLTLVYEGDDNPLTTIYKDLPISTIFPDGSTTSLKNYFNSLPAEEREVGATNKWNDNGLHIYTWFNVGIGTTHPHRKLHVYEAGDANIWTEIETAGVNHKAGFIYTNDAESWTVGTDGSNSDAFAIDNNIGISNSPEFVIMTSGNVGIGTDDPPYKLSVNGTIICTTLRVKDTPWSDFVFYEDYRLPTLQEVENYIKEKGHLPGIPTEAEVKEKGVNVGEISSKLLQKIEELTLYVIDLKKENEALKAKMASVENSLKEQ